MSNAEDKRKLKLSSLSESPTQKRFAKRYSAISALVFLEQQGRLPISKSKIHQIFSEIAGLTHHGRVEAFSNEKKSYHHDIIECIAGNISIRDNIKTFLLSLNWELSPEDKRRVIQLSDSEDCVIE